MTARSCVLVGFLAFSLQALADPIDDFIQKKMEENATPGLCLAIIGPDNNPDVRSYGIANLESGEEVSPSTVFRIASLSKQFTGYAILKLAEEGKLSLDDPFTKHFPALPATFNAVTIKTALGHRSGIADPGSDFSFRTEYTVPAYVNLLGSKPLAEKPGETYRYNNHAYALLGIIVGQTDGTSLPEYMKREVFEKLGMSNSSYFAFEDIIPHRAQGYDYDNGDWKRRFMLRPSVFHASGGILTSMEDFLKYEFALRSQDVLSKTVLQKQWTPIFGGESGYGGGWNVRKDEDTHSLLHTGSTFGFTSLFFRDLKTKTTIIIFRNSAEGSLTSWLPDLQELIKSNSKNPPLTKR